ncbi:MAG: SDR family NAD(P)-dependent oxidoreductase [Actinomycetota bacterium]
MSYKNSSRKLALVTGAAGGIGFATAEHLAKDGYDLFLIDFNAESLEEAKKALAQYGVIIDSAVLDLADSENVLSVLSKKLEDFEVDALVNNAGIGYARTVEQTTLDEWDRTFDVNIKATFITCKLIVPQMIARGGAQL